MDYCGRLLSQQSDLLDTIIVAATVLYIGNSVSVTESGEVYLRLCKPQGGYAFLSFHLYYFSSFQTLAFFFFIVETGGIFQRKQ